MVNDRSCEDKDDENRKGGTCSVPTSRVLEEFSVRAKDLTPEQMNVWLETPKFAVYVENELLKAGGIKSFWGLTFNDFETDSNCFKERLVLLNYPDLPSSLQLISPESRGAEQGLAFVYTDRFTLKKATFRKVLHWRRKDNENGEVEYGIEKDILLHGGGQKILTVSKIFWGRTE